MREVAEIGAGVPVALVLADDLVGPELDSVSRILVVPLE